MNKEILFLNPVFTHNIWGGTKLREEYGYDVGIAFRGGDE